MSDAGSSPCSMSALASKRQLSRGHSGKATIRPGDESAIELSLRSHPWLGLQVLAQNFVVLWKNCGAGKTHSERRACITSTRAARAAGSIEATIAAPNSTNAETTAGHAPGIFRSPK